MARRERCLLEGVACHITQRGVDRRETFGDDSDRETYLGLLKWNLAQAKVQLLAWCLMTNHVHLVAIPQGPESLAVLLRRVHGRYAQYFNARYGRQGHLWQNRYFACALGPGHLWAALAYVERNPVRAGMVWRAGEYRWSSAAAHLQECDRRRLIDLDWWRAELAGRDWREALEESADHQLEQLRRCTYAGHPFGDAAFEEAVAQEFGRHWRRGRPAKQALAAGAAA
jgi:putative transposase